MTCIHLLYFGGLHHINAIVMKAPLFPHKNRGTIHLDIIGNHNYIYTFNSN